MRWEIVDPDDAVMVSDGAGILRIKHIPEPEPDEDEFFEPDDEEEDG